MFLNILFLIMKFDYDNSKCFVRAKFWQNLFSFQKYLNMAVYWIISKSLCQKMNMAVYLLDLNKKGQLSWLSDNPILFKFKFKWSISNDPHFFFWNKLFFLWVYFLKFHYKLILLDYLIKNIFLLYSITEKKTKSF